MSTSPETSPKASPSSEREAALRRAAAVSAAGLAFVALCRIPWGELAAQVSERRAAEWEVAPLVEQAKLFPMDYETAEAGKPVVWCVDHPAAGDSYVEGRQTERVFWSNEDAVPTNNMPKGRCMRVLAMVEGRSPQGVVLRHVRTLSLAWK